MMLYSLKYFELFYIIHTISHVQKLNTELAGSQINNLTIDLKQLEKEEMKNPRVSRRKEIFHFFELVTSSSNNKR